MFSHSIVRDLLILTTSSSFLVCFSAIADSLESDKHQELQSPLVPEMQVNPTYHSVFSIYQAYEDQEVLPWKEVNRRTEEAGGWRNYLREPRTAESKLGPAAGHHQHD